MAISNRVASIVLAVVASALTITGIVVAATDSNPTASVGDPLALNGYPPKSSDLHVVISTGRAYDVTANVNINFVTNAVEANVQVPMFFSSTNVDLRLVHRHLYAGFANLRAILGASWLSTPVSQPALYNLSLEMTRPDVALIKGFTREVITKNGYSTTYSYHRDNVAITTPNGLPLALPTHAAVDFTLTIGSQGEMTASSFTVTSKRSRAFISVTVLSYNQPARINTPAPHDVKGFNSSILRQIFGRSPITSLLTPHGVASLGTIRLS